jgi:hypothetical protein
MMDRKLRGVILSDCLIWGVQDRFAGRGLAEASIGMCDDGPLGWIEEATHWVQHEGSPIQ